MNFFKKTALLFLLFTGQGFAFTPESGFWWNSNEPGSGYSIEIQDNFMFVAFYVYDTAGNPLWYTAAGSLQGNSYFDYMLDYSFNGTCIDCGFSSPVTLLGDGGPVTIDFQTETTGTIQFNGAIKNIQRFNFILGDELEKMLGEWQVVFDTTGFTDPDTFPFFADVLIFNQTEFFQGEDIVTGCRSESTIYNNCTNFAYNNDIAAYHDFSDGFLYIVVNDSEDFYLTYKVDVGTRQFDGQAYSYLKGTNPDLSSDGFLVRGFRSASRTFVESGSGPSKTLDGKKANTRKFQLPLTKTTEDKTAHQKQLTIINKLEQFLENK